MIKSTRFRIDTHGWAALLVALFAFAAAVAINGSVFERLPHLEDEFAYLYQARIFARGQLWVPRNEPVKVFWQPFVVQPEQTSDGIHKRFGKYTPGWPLLLAPGAALDAAWIMNAFFAALNVLLTYRIGREVFAKHGGKSIGLVAALLVAISPMSLLLNATLMAHTSAMTLTMVFFYAYWRIVSERIQPAPRRAGYVWGAVGGLALGLMLASRPLTAVAAAAPVVIHAGLLLLGDLFRARERFWRRLRPLVVLAICVAPTGALWPAFNHIWTGDWRTNVYTLVWPYDRVGFGIGHGPNQTEGHTLTKGWRNARNDLKFYFRDLYGFTLNTNALAFAETNLGYGLGIGLSYMLIAAGLVAGWRSGWIWLLFALLAMLVVVQIGYWIGSSVNGAAAYSVRYYYEATFAVSLVSAYGVVALARTLSRQPDARRPRTASPALTDYLIYGGLLVACASSVISYSPARFREPLPPRWNDGLWRYNAVGQHKIDEIEKIREKSGTPDKPVLIIVLRDPDPAVRGDWRDYAAAMALTSPFLDSEIVVARVFEAEDVEIYTRRFPDRLVLFQIGEGLHLTIDTSKTAGP